MTQRLVVVGAGGFGREVLDVIDAIRTHDPEAWDVVGVVDDQPSPENLSRLAARDVDHLGPVSALVGLGSPPMFVVGVGSPEARRALALKCESAGLTAAPPLVHPTASLGRNVTVGEGTVICAGVRITTNIRIGRHVHLNLNATVGHDAVIGDFVSINPLASISGDCSIGDGVLIGVGAILLNGINVAAGARIGGSACVVRDVGAGCTVKGVPAR